MRSTLLAISVAAVFALAGCGSDDKSKDSDSGDDAPVALTKAEFIEQADAICKAANEELQKVPEGFADPNNPTAEEVENGIKDAVIPGLQGEVDDIGDLTAPKEDEAAIKAILDSLQADIDKAEDDWQYLMGNGALDEASDLAKAYGFEVCGEQ